MRPAEAEPESWRAWVPPGAPRVWLAAIMIVATALRLAALDKPLYIDEIVTITMASQPLAAMAGAMRQIDASPVFFPLLLHAWMGVSQADAWVRLLPAIFGILAVPAVGLIACRAFGWRAGLAAAAVMAIAPAHVHYAQYVRSYSLFTLFVALHVLAVMEWTNPRVRLTLRRVAVLVLLTTALLYTHYLSLLLLPAEGLFVLGHVRKGPERVVAWTAAVVCALLLFLPGVPLLLHNMTFDRVRNASRPERAPLVRLVPDLVGELSVGQRIIGFDDPRIRRATLSAAAVLFPTLFAAGLVAGFRGRRDRTLLLLAVSLVPLAIYIGSGRRLVAVRFFLPFMAGYVAILGCGLASLRAPLARAAAGAALVLVCAVPLWHFFTDFEWSYDHRGVAQAIAAASQPGDIILVVHPYEALYYRWYLGDRMPAIGMVFTALEDQKEYVIKPPSVEFSRARARIAAAASTHPRMWVIGQSPRSFASDAKEQARVLAWMDATYERAADLGNLTGNDPIVRLYTVKSAAAAPAY